jgi:Family of unknown function (DUF6580)
MLSTLPNTFRAWRALRTDLAVVAGLVGLDIAARLLPHAPDFTPVATSALFAASVLRVRALSVVVPLAGMILADAWLGFYDLRIMAAVYGTLALPACAAWLSGRWRRPVMIAPVLVSSSLSFFLVTNFAVWAFSPMYAANAGGLLKCYIAALPFLQNMLSGNLFWGIVLFGGYWLARNVRAAKRDDRHTIAARA